MSVVTLPDGKTASETVSEPTLSEAPVIERCLNERRSSDFGTPNFFLLGAGKCGTWTLYDVLRQHPQIFMSAVKEPTFFCSYFQVISNPVTYFSLFGGSAGYAAVGEASHGYFSNPESAALLHALFPRAKFVLILRNPARRAFSLYNFMKFYGLDTIESFERALEEEEKRFHDQEFAAHCPQYFWNYLYKRSGLYDVQWRRYLNLYPADRFFVMTLQELADRSATAIRSLYEFLEVDPAFEPVIKKLNHGSDAEMLPETRALLDDYYQESRKAVQTMAGRELDLTHL